MIACVFVGLALATRYVGVTLLPPLVFGLVFLGNQPLKDRMRDVFIAIPLACVPLGIWLSRNFLTAESATNRNFALHPVGLAQVESLIHALYGLVLPISISGRVKALHLLFAITLLIVGLGVLCKKYSKGEVTKYPTIIFTSLSLLFCIVYIIFLLTSVSFFDAQTLLDGRIVSPIFGFLIVAVVSLSWSVSKSLQNPSIWFVFVLFVLFSSIVNGNRAMSFAVEMHSNGNGYMSQHWRNSESIAFVKLLDNRARIYSNGSDVIKFLSGRQAISIPEKVNPILGNRTIATQRICKLCVVSIQRMGQQWCT
jgi:hypothetical protein